jgi:hypothetical protein
MEQEAAEERLEPSRFQLGERLTIGRDLEPTKEIDPACRHDPSPENLLIRQMGLPLSSDMRHRRWQGADRTVPLQRRVSLSVSLFSP